MSVSRRTRIATLARTLTWSSLLLAAVGASSLRVLERDSAGGATSTSTASLVAPGARDSESPGVAARSES